MAMNHLFGTGQLDQPFGLLSALLVGLLFGFWLERAGFGSSRKLTAIFYLQDFAVLKVMFTAMATASLVLAALAGLGLVDLHSLFVPETVLWPQAVGGLVFGAGFVIGGWCPGTAAVGLASGRLDAVAFLAGAAGGSLLFAAMSPSLAGLMRAGACGDCVLTDQLGVGPLAGALALAAVALMAFVMAERIEKWQRRIS
jgi:hypothetical protein